MNKNLYAEISTIDPATNCWIEKKIVAIENQEKIKEAIHLEEIEMFAIYDIDESDLRNLISLYTIKFKKISKHGQIVFSDNEKMLSTDTHTGRELLLMLAGKKPLAAFVEEFNNNSKYENSYEEYFDKFLSDGKIAKKTYIHKSKIGKFRRILYASIDQEWRIDAYIYLWVLADKYGWNNGFEKIEGFLLGYETDIDPFFLRVTSITIEDSGSDQTEPHLP